MKKFVFLMIFALITILNVYSDGDDDVSFNFIRKFFANNDFAILDEQFITEANHFSMAVHFINSELGVYDKAIIYECEGDNIFIHLVLKDFVFHDSNGRVIFDFTNTLYELKGFSSRFLYPDPERTQALSGLELDGHFGDTLYTSDPFFIDWDPELLLFIKYEINWNEM